MQKGKWEFVGETENGALKYRHSMTKVTFYFKPELGCYDFFSYPCAPLEDGSLRICFDLPQVDLAGKLLTGKIEGV